MDPRQILRQKPGTSQPHRLGIPIRVCAGVFRRVCAVVHRKISSLRVPRFAISEHGPGHQTSTRAWVVPRAAG